MSREVSWSGLERPASFNADPVPGAHLLEARTRKQRVAGRQSPLESSRWSRSQTGEPSLVAAEGVVSLEATLRGDRAFSPLRVVSVSPASRGLSELEAVRLRLEVPVQVGQSGSHFGDYLEIMPQNDLDRVRELMRRVGARGQELVLGGSGGPRPLWRVLVEELDLATFSEELQQLLVHAARGAERGALLRRLEGDRRCLDVLDLLDGLSQPPPLQAMLPLFMELRPRTYAIASVHGDPPGALEILVWPRAVDSGVGERLGVASQYLCRRLQPGDEVWARVRRARSLEPPPAADAPVIVLSAGAGIVMACALLSEFERRGPQRATWLVLASDGVLRAQVFEAAVIDQLNRWQDSGVLKHFDRSSPPRRSRFSPLEGQLRKRAKRLGAWVHRDAVVYILGELGEPLLGLYRCFAEAQRLSGGAEETDEALIERWQRTGRLRVECYTPPALHAETT